VALSGNLLQKKKRDRHGDVTHAKACHVGRGHSEMREAAKHMCMGGIKAFTDGTESLRARNVGELIVNDCCDPGARENVKGNTRMNCGKKASSVGISGGGTQRVKTRAMFSP